MAFLDDLKTQILELLAQQTLMTKALSALVLGGFMALMVFLVWRQGKPVETELLWADLDVDATARVREELERSGVTPKITETNKGYMVEVPYGTATDWRLKLASTISDMEGSKGWGLFNEKDFGSTAFSQEIKKQRAIMGELSRTIRRMEMVRDASVQFTPPDDSPFLQVKEPAKASVLLSILPGKEISDEQVQAIRALVAGSIEKLTPENVTVVDTLGNELSRERRSGISETEEKEQAEIEKVRRLNEIRLTQTREHEEQLKRNIIESLAPVFGRGHVSANVNVEYDYTKKRENATEYDTKNVVPASVAYDVKSSDLGNDQLMAEGVVGVTKHVPPAQIASGFSTATAERYEYISQKIINNLASKKETETVYPEFQIKRVTASVFVDNFPTVLDTKNEEGEVVGTRTTRNRVEVNPETKELVETTVPNTLSEVEIQGLETIVKNIIGYSEERPGGLSDAVAVTNLAFNGAPALIGADGADRELYFYNLIMQVLRVVLLLSALVLTFWFIVRPLMRQVAPKTAPALAALTREAALQAVEERVMLEREAAPEAPGALDAEEGYEALPEPSEAEEKMDEFERLQKKQLELDEIILELARENPKKVPLVLRSWMEG